jgi:hypothetical protein
MGFPVSFAGVEIGDFTWVPGATINPGVRIGRNCVIGVNSLVTRDIPDGSLAGGSPAKVLREHAFPAPLAPEARLAFYEEFLTHYAHLIGFSGAPQRSEEASAVLVDDGTTVYAAALSYDARIASAIANRPRVLLIADGACDASPSDGWTLLDTQSKRVRGVADSLSNRLTNELRRYGIRFYSRGVQGMYSDWGDPRP